MNIEKTFKHENRLFKWYNLLKIKLLKNHTIKRECLKFGRSDMERGGGVIWRWGDLWECSETVNNAIMREIRWEIAKGSIYQLIRGKGKNWQNNGENRKRDRLREAIPLHTNRRKLSTRRGKRDERTIKVQFLGQIGVSRKIHLWRNVVKYDIRKRL